MLKTKVSLFVILLTAFIDYAGIGLVYPLFSYLMLNPEGSFLPVGTTELQRGLFLGVLISLYSVGQFFSGAILGKLSDRVGRKKILVGALFFCTLGYLISIFGIEYKSLSLLLLSRLIIGVAAGSVGVVQAAIADISTPENKSRNFGLYSMFLGVGFAVGPFLGGLLVNPNFFQGYSLPFWIGGLFSLANLFLVLIYFKETNAILSNQEIKWTDSFKQYTKIFSIKEIRIIQLVTFIYIFGWSFYYEFIPLYLMGKFDFTASNVGNFYAYAAVWYAIASGFLIAPLFKKFKLETLLFSSFLCLGILIFVFLLMPNWLYLAFYLPMTAYFSALVFPTATSIVSNSVGKDTQGEALGIFQSVQAMGWAIAPLVSGFLLCLHICMPIFVGGTTLLIAALIFGGWLYCQKFRQTESLLVK